MTAYERWVQEAGELLVKSIPSLSAADASELRSLVEHLSLPGLLAFSGGTGGAQGNLGPALVRAAAVKIAQVPEFQTAGFSAEEIERFLTRIFVQRERPTTLLADSALRRRLLAEASSKLAESSGLVVSPAEAQRIAELLDSGELFRDVAAGTATILYTVRNVPIALVDDAKNAWRRIVALPFAVLLDLSSTPGDAQAVVTDLLDGTLDHPPAILSHTLRALYRFATLRSTVAMLNELISPDNESVRLAVVLYARANGVQLDLADLDALRKSVLDPQNPSLGPALVAAWGRLPKGSELKTGRDLLARLGARSG